MHIFSQEKLLHTQRAFRSQFLENILHQWSQRTLRLAFGVLRRHAHDAATNEKFAAVHVRSLLMFVNGQRVELLRQAFGLWRVEELSRKLDQVCYVWQLLAIVPRKLPVSLHNSHNNFVVFATSTSTLSFSSIALGPACTFSARDSPTPAAHTSWSHVQNICCVVQVARRLG